MGAERWDEQVGSVADEAIRLLESLRRSAADEAVGPLEGENTSDAAASVPGTEGGAGPDVPAHDPSCTWCPLCRGAAVIRSLSPQTLARLADLASLAATVLTELAGSRPADGSTASGGSPAGDATQPHDGPTGAATRPAARSRRTSPAPTRSIPVHDADDPQEAPRG